MWPLRYLVIEIKLRDNLRRQESPAIRLEVRPMRGNATNASQLATGPKIARKSSPGHAQPANKQVIGRGVAFSPEGKGRAPALEMAMLDD